MNYHSISLINKELLFAAQSPQGLKRCANAQLSKRVLFAAQSSMTKECVVPHNILKGVFTTFFKKNQTFTSAQSPQGLKRCADAQRFLKKIRHLLLLNLS